MVEKVGSQDILVRNYTSNFDVKEFIQEVLIPRAFPGVPMNKLNLGFTGITSEMISTAIEDSYATASLMLNEAFITRAVLPSSIYSEASLFDLGYTFATPSRCNFAVQLWMEDVLENSYRVRNTPTRRFHLDKNTRIILGDNTYRFDYDVIIDHQYIDGRISFNTYYDIDEDNSIAIVTNKHVKHQATAVGWLILFVELQEFSRKVEENRITDNLITTNSDIYLRWYDQIAGMDLVYITPNGERLPMTKKIQHTRPEHEPFCWFAFHNDDTLKLMFSNSRGFFQPAFNSKIESTIYTCIGANANFDTYDSRMPVPVEAFSQNFEYNAKTRMVALCFGGSRGGSNRGDIELLRNDVIVAHNTVDVLTTDTDLSLWFTNYARRHNTRAYFFKRRDDPTGKLFAQFVAITHNTYVYPTNTLTMDVTQDQFDFINCDKPGCFECDETCNQLEFIIKPGHIWEYVDINITDRLTDEMKVKIRNKKPLTISCVECPTCNDCLDCPICAELKEKGLKETKCCDCCKNPECCNNEECGECVCCDNDFHELCGCCINERRLLLKNKVISQLHQRIYWRDKDDTFWTLSRDTVRMVQGTDGYAMVTDEVLPSLTDDRPFMFTNPFYIKVYKQPAVSANFNYLLNHTSWPEDIPINTDIFYQFQLATLTIQRSLSREYENKYRIQIVCIPVVSQNTMEYLEGIGEEFNIRDNNLRIVMITRTRMDGETGYIEMYPIEELDGGAYLFETEITINDNLRSDMMLEIDKVKTPEIISLISNGPREGKIFLDSAETSLHFAVMIRDASQPATTWLYNDTTFQGYTMCNKFSNDHRQLTLYQPMNMMRSAVTFAGKNNDYKVRISLVPMLRYNIPLDDESMLYFIRAFSDQYTAVEPVLKRLDGNSFLDFKLFNTYGRSNNYYVGPPDDSDVLWDSDELLDNVYVSMKWKMAVWDRSSYVQTVDAVIDEIKLYFENLDVGQLVDIHISQLIHIIKENQPNVHYIRFLGFNKYDARKQSIFVKYDHISELRRDQLQIYVPEMIRVDSQSIQIIEEI